MTRLFFKSIGEKSWVLTGFYQGNFMWVTGENENECLDQLLKLVNAA